MSKLIKSDLTGTKSGEFTISHPSTAGYIKLWVDPFGGFSYVSVIDASVLQFSATDITAQVPVMALDIVDLGGAVRRTGAATESNLTANQSGWNPSGASVVRFTANSGLTIQGIMARAAGTELTLLNVGSNSISIAHNSFAADLGNKIFCPGNTAYTLRANGAVKLWYDGTSNYWRVVAA